MQRMILQSPATNLAAAKPTSSGYWTTSEPHQPSSSLADEVVINLDGSSKETIYSFNNDRLLVGFPHKIEPSLALQMRWKDEIEPQLCHDVEAFQRRTKPVVRRGRVLTPRLSVELRMSGHVKIGDSQVTLVPTIWFLYDDKRWEKDTRRFVGELEWLSGEGFGTPEIQKGCPRFTKLQIPVERLHLSALKYAGIPLPGGGELYIHVEEPQSSTACGLLCCTTFVQDGEVSAQHVSRIGGLMNLDERTAAVTTAHGFLEEISSRTYQRYLGDNTEPDEEPLSDDEEPPGPQKLEQCIGRIDSGTVDSMSWFQLSPTSIQETCFFGVDGSNIDQLLLRTLQHLEKASNAWGKNKLPATELSTDSRAAQSSDFSFLSLSDKGNLYNCYQSVEDKFVTRDKVVYRLAEPREMSAGLVYLLLRPGEASRGVLLPGTMLFSPYRDALQTYKVVLDRPLG